MRAYLLHTYLLLWFLSVDRVRYPIWQWHPCDGTCRVVGNNRKARRGAPPHPMSPWINSLPCPSSSTSMPTTPWTPYLRLCTYPGLPELAGWKVPRLFPVRVQGIDRLPVTSHRSLARDQANLACSRAQNTRPAWSRGRPRRRPGLSVCLSTPTMYTLQPLRATFSHMPACFTFTVAILGGCTYMQPLGWARAGPLGR